MRINQSATAIDVYHAPDFRRNVAQPQQLNILAVMVPDRDYTIGELSSLAGIDKSAVSGRRNAMLSMGSASPLERGADRKCTISGRVCETVRIKADLLGRMAA